jgi:hypothetical protein
MIPLGILATTAGGGGGGSYELIETAYGTGSSGTVSFDVSSLGSTYKHLQIRSVIRSTGSGSNSIYLRFNNVTTSTYTYHRLRGNGSNVASSGFGDENRIQIDGAMAGSGDDAGRFGASVIDILDFGSTTKNKTAKALSGGPEYIDWIGLASGVWLSTSAITSIQVSYPSNAFTTTSRFSLYGIRG